MAKRTLDRQKRLALLARAQERQLTGLASLSLKELLELEMAKAMKGGDRELGYESLFGEAKLQGSML